MNNFQFQRLDDELESTSGSSETSKSRRVGSSDNGKSSGSVSKKKKSSEKERHRNQEIKRKLETIRHKVPFVEKDLSKIRTLRLASAYITHLKRIISGEMIKCSYTGALRPLMTDDFKHVVMKEMQVTNSYKERADIENAQASSSSISPSFHSPPIVKYENPNDMFATFMPIYQPESCYSFPPDYLSNEFCK